MNKYCPNKNSKEYKELVEIFGEDKTYLLWKRNHDSLDKAPNGADSKLFLSLLDYYKGDREKALRAKAKTLTDEFFNWFGDWTSEDRESVSKAVDENGEPMVLWHGTDNVFKEFEYDEDGKRGGHKVHDRHSFFFTDSQEKAFKYKHSITMACYLNMRNPGESSVKDGKYQTLEEYTDRENELIKDPQYDSVLIERFDKEGNRNGMEPTKLWVVKNPNLIKSVDNNGKFSTENNNIYHSLPLIYKLDSYIQPIYQKLKEQKLLTKFNNMYLILQGKDDEYNYTRHLIEQEAAANNVSVKFKERNKAVEVIFANLKPELMDTEDLTYEKDRNKIIELISILEKAFPEYHVSRDAAGQYEFINPKDIPEGINKDANAFLRGKTIYLVKGRVTADSTVEEFLHPLINTIQLHNYQLFKLLLDEASNAFPKLKQQIYSTYTNEKGFNEYTRQNELVTQAILRKSMFKLNKKDRAKLLDLVRQMWNYVARKIQAAFTRYGDIIEVDPTKLPKMTIDELTDIISASNVRFRTGYSRRQYGNAQHSISALNKSEQEIAEGITKRFSILYKAYEKMPNKSPRRQLIQNKLFELYNQLQEHQDIEAGRIAINYALETIGTLDDQTGLATDPSSVLGFLQRERQKADPFSGITPRHLVDIQLNSIGFYENLLENYIPNELNTNWDTEDRQKIKELSSSIAAAKSIWIEAMTVVGDRIVDEQIEREVDADQIDKDNMKAVAKDWLHKNIMYGDISAFESYVFNNGYSSNPIIKQVFHMIQDAETRTLEEIHPIAQLISTAYNKANKLYKQIGPNWLTVMMEFNHDGIPTGNFVRETNYGQYQEDLENFIKNLNDEFIRDYGHTYVDNGSGIVVNSLTNELAEDEEWLNGAEPTYIRYLKRIEEWKCEHAHRRYTFDYYKERMSEPYKGSLDPNEVDVNKFGHGLSPKTLSRYNHILSNINYYLDKCTDPKTGLSYPEKLDDQDKKSLDTWQEALQDLLNPFNTDMTPKQDSERRIAFEIRAWLKWLGQRLLTKINLDDYVNELQRLQTEASSTGNWKPVHDFVKYNSSIGIHPDFIELTIGRFSGSLLLDQEAIHANYLKAALLSMVKTSTGYTRDFSSMENKPEFWLQCKRMDLLVEDGARTNADPDFAKELENNFEFEQILYRDAYGRAIDSNGNPINPSDEHLHNDLLTWQQYLINKYTNLAINSPTRTILGLNDANGNPIVFNGTPDLVKKVIAKLFTYRKEKSDDQGNITVEDVPLTIFSMMVPKSDVFVNRKTGRTERTILQVPKGRFAEKADRSNKFINKHYDHKDPNSELPRHDYSDNRGHVYDNTEAFNKLKGDTKSLYDLLVLTMEDAQKNYSTQNRAFNYKLPQINADSMLLMSRLISLGFKNTAQSLFDSLTTIEENDERMRTAEDYITSPDGSVALDVPLKFVRNLKDPSRLTTDVVGSVILFVNMALNYKNKTAIDAQIKTLRYNLDKNNRNQTETTSGEFKPQDDRNSMDMFDSMLNKHMYNNQWNRDPQEGSYSRASVAGHKILLSIHRLETTQMLALNLFSMIVGFGDSMSRIIKESIMGKYMSPRDSITALISCIIRTPSILMNIGNPVANNKLTRAMLLNGVSKGVHQTYSHMNYSRVKKGFYNILMGGFSLLDWMANALLLRSYYNNCRLYEGNIIPKGFYTTYEILLAFVNAGKTKQEARVAHMMSTTTLWGAYDKNMQLKPEFSDSSNPNFICEVPQKTKTRIRTKTIQRSALYNGMNPDNDTPRYKGSLIGLFVGAMRGWLTLAVQHLLAGGSDNIVRNVTDIKNYNVKLGKTFQISSRTKDKLTDELRARRMSWNYETGTPNDQIYIGIVRSFTTLGKKLWRYATLNTTKAKEAKFSYVEKYAWRDAIIYLGILGLCMIAWPMLNEQAAAVPPPKSREEAGPTNLQNVPDWFMNQYIGDLYWKLQASDVGFRIIEAQITSIDPTSAMDVINSITTLLSGVNEHLGIVKAAGDVTGLSGHSTDEVVKQGGYKYYTRGERNIYKAVGPLDNLQTAFTYYGITTNQSFYTNTYGGIYRGFGYDFKHEKKKKSSGPSFSGPTSSGPSFGGPSFK